MSTDIQLSLSSKGQITVPAKVRKHLGLAPGDRISMQINEQGDVLLKAPRFPTIESLTGFAGRLDTPLSIDEMKEIAYRERMRTRFGGE